MTGDFLEDLKQFGPQAVVEKPLTLAEAQAYCRRLATSHYENFPMASWLLPKPLHQHFYNVYAYCRWSDDLGDEVEDPQQSLELLTWWRGELADCYAGQTRHPVFIALAETIREFDIPPKPFEDLLSAFEQDQTVTSYQTFAQLENYCQRSANPVGRLVLYLIRQHTPENAAYSDGICTGLQLANFWQDVARDFAIGRVYLPREDFTRFGYSEEDLQNQRTTEAFLAMMEFQVKRARQFLESGLPLIPRLPGRLQVDIELFALGGLKILERIERIGYRVWETRPIVTKGDVLRLFCKSLYRTGRRRLKKTPENKRS